MVPILRDILAAHKASARRTGPDDLVSPTDRNKVTGPHSEREVAA